MRRILGITGIRSDYDLMSPLYRRLAADTSVELRLLVGGAHLAKSYGYSFSQIQKDEIGILQTIESLIDADSKSSRLKSASILLQNTIDPVANWNPDLILYAGDREEVLVGGMLGSYLEIPTVHFYGGDQIDSGHVDNSVRHAASKLSTHHMVTMEEHRQRLLALGEPARRISVIGSMALDNFNERSLSRTELEQRLGLPKALGDYALVLFHPEPTERDAAPAIARHILQALKAAGIGACVGHPNTDPANKDLSRVFDEFRSESRFFFYTNLERVEFISLYKGARFIIGNSSSGIIEAASVPIPSISVGARQRGRRSGRNVVFAATDPEPIAAAIAEVEGASFRTSIAGMENPYGDGRSGQRAYDLLMRMDFAAARLKTEDPLEIESGTGFRGDC